MESGPSIWTSMRGWLSPTVLFLFLNIVIGTIAVTSRSLRSRRDDRQRLSGQQSGEFPSENDPQPLSRGPSAGFDLFRTFSIYRSRSGDDYSVADYGAASQHAAPSYSADAPSQRHAPASLQRGPSSVLERLCSIGLQRLRSGVSSSVDNDHGEPHSPPSRSKDVAQLQAPPPSLSRGPSFVLERLRSISLRRFRSGDIPEDDEAKAEEETPASQHAEDVGDHPHYDRSLSDSWELAAGKLAGKMKKSASAGAASAHLSTPDVVRSRAAKGAPEEVAEEHDRDEVDARAEDFISRFKQQLKLQRLDSIMRVKHPTHPIPTIKNDICAGVELPRCSTQQD